MGKDTQKILITWSAILSLLLAFALGLNCRKGPQGPTLRTDDIVRLGDGRFVQVSEDHWGEISDGKVKGYEVKLGRLSNEDESYWNFSSDDKIFEKSAQVNLYHLDDPYATLVRSQMTVIPVVMITPTYTPTPPINEESR